MKNEKGVKYQNRNWNVYFIVSKIKEKLFTFL